MFGNDRREMRRFFTQAWNKHNHGETLEPIERLIAVIIQKHPEYHTILEQEELALDKDYPPEAGESNPFLHISMHLGLQDQISMDRPPGISAAYRKLIMANGGDAHAADHMIMECLAQMIWDAQINNKTPDEQAYLECIDNLVGRQ